MRSLGFIGNGINQSELRLSLPRSSSSNNRAPHGKCLRNYYEISRQIREFICNKRSACLKPHPRCCTRTKRSFRWIICKEIELRKPRNLRNNKQRIERNPRRIYWKWNKSKQNSFCQCWPLRATETNSITAHGQCWCNCCKISRPINFHLVHTEHVN